MRILFIILMVICFQDLAAQESKKYLKYKDKPEWREGYVVLKDSIKIEGLVKEYPLNIQKQHSSVLFVNRNGEKKNYYPNDLFEYGFGYTKKFFSNSSNFFQKVKTGKKVSLYKIETLERWGTLGSSSPGFTSQGEYIYFKKNNQYEFKNIRKKNFVKEFSEYFSDCQLLKDKILREELTHKDYKAIMKEYNFNCNGGLSYLRQEYR